MIQQVTPSLNIPQTTKPRVVIVGGGFGGIYAAKGLVGSNYQVVMLSAQNYFSFWPLLYQVATADLEPDAIAYPLRKLFARRLTDFYFRVAQVTSVNSTAKTISTPAGELTYDYLVIATGTRANYFGNEQMRQFAFPLKGLPDALNLRSQVLQVLEQASVAPDESTRQQLLNIVIVGGGPTGVEVAGALAEMRQYVLPGDYPDMDHKQFHIYLVEGNDRLLHTMSSHASHTTRQDLEKMGVLLRLNTLVDEYDGQIATLKNGEQIPTRTLIWTAGVTGATLAGLPTSATEGSRYKVNPYSQLENHPDIFAIGDVALMRSADYPAGYPNVAQPAMQQGSHLAKNLRRLQLGKTLLPFKYLDYGSLAIIGRNKAVGDFPGKLQLTGFPVWVVWLFIHFCYVVGFRNKLVVMANWLYHFFTFQGGTRLIIRPVTRQGEFPKQPSPRLEAVDA
ncbi:NAD(P)/FAD-dependent oxidoreductase [Spirosoma flavus]